MVEQTPTNPDNSNLFLSSYARILTALQQMHISLERIAEIMQTAPQGITIEPELQTQLATIPHHLLHGQSEELYLSAQQLFTNLANGHPQLFDEANDSQLAQQAKQLQIQMTELQDNLQNTSKQLSAVSTHDKTALTKLKTQLENQLVETSNCIREIGSLHVNSLQDKDDQLQVQSQLDALDLPKPSQ